MIPQEIQEICSKELLVRGYISNINDKYVPEIMQLITQYYYL